MERRIENADTNPMRNPHTILEMRVKQLEGYVWWLRLWFGLGTGVIAALVACLVLWAKYIPRH